MSDKHPIEAAHSEAREARYRAERAKDNEIEAALREVSARIRADAAAKHDAGIQSLREAERAAVAAYNAWREAEGAAKLAGRTTAMVEWAGPKWGRGPLTPTGRKGVLMVRTSACEFAGNLSDYSLPAIGAEYIRLLKANGTPSLQIVTRGAYGWHAEGVDPNAKRDAA
jgi:hypothetical protein